MTTNFSISRSNAQKSVADIMTRDMVTLELNDTLRLADDIMNLVKIRHFPVLDNGKVAGLINQSELLHASMRSLLEHTKGSLRQALGAVAVKEVMVPATLAPTGTSIQAAARIMVEKNIDCLLVVEGGLLVGLVTRTDLLRELANA